jgi:hypothetical protein
MLRHLYYPEPHAPLHTSFPFVHACNTCIHSVYLDGKELISLNVPATEPRAPPPLQLPAQPAGAAAGTPAAVSPTAGAAGMLPAQNELIAGALSLLQS